MSDSKLDFSKARPGDVLWSDMFGDVTYGLQERRSDGVLMVYCRTAAGRVNSWLANGDYAEDAATNDLHWSRPVFEEPPPPKRMKKIRIERRIHVTKWGAHIGYDHALWIQPFHQSCPPECISHFDVCHEFEVEE